MKKRIIQALRLEETDKRPLWIMRQAGRYLPEYRKLREKYTFLELSGSAELSAEVTLQPLKRFPLDAGIIFADIMSPLPSLGIKFDFAPGPIIDNPIQSFAQVKALPSDFHNIAPEVIKAIGFVKKEMPSSTALIGFGGAPWTLAAYLIQGKGVKDFPLLRRFAYAEPDALQLLMEKLSDLSLQYYIAQFEAGADLIQIFDSWAGLLSLEEWQLWIQPHLKRITQELNERNIPTILFLQNANHLVNAYASMPVAGIGVDWRVNLSELQGLVGNRLAIQGNIDPAILLAGVNSTKNATKALFKSVKPKGHIMNLGHGILPNTPIESVEAIIEVINNEVSR
jgi:uroporphyrinogen decarboxylase